MSKEHFSDNDDDDDDGFKIGDTVYYDDDKPWIIKEISPTNSMFSIYRYGEFAYVYKHNLNHKADHKADETNRSTKKTS